MRPHAGSRSAAASQGRDPSKAIANARRHSALVRGLKYALPACALLVAGLYFLSSGFSVSLGPLDASVSRIEVNRDALRMVNPKIEGVTEEGGKFVVRAAYADQDVAQPSRISLNKVNAEVIQPGEGWSRLTAPRGKYDSKTEALQLLDDIQVTSQSGLHAYLSEAAIDLKKQTVKSAQPVRADMPSGNVRADTLHIDMKQNVLTFERNVRVHVERGAQQVAAQAPVFTTGSVSTTDGVASRGAVASLNSREPIDIAAPKLTIFDKTKLAHFTGGVAATQGQSQLTARELKVHYTGDGAGLTGNKAASASGGQTGADIRFIEALEEVRMTTPDGRRANGQHMLFDVQKQTVQLTGNVTLEREGDVLTGAQLLVNLATGVSQFVPGARVRGHLMGRGKTPAQGAERKNIEIGAGQLDLSSAQGKPIDIEADGLTVSDRERTALFKGDVQAVQGDMTMRSRELLVNYTGTAQTAAQGAGADDTQITKITAKGKVLITTDKQGQTSTSDWALFDVKAQTVTIGGNVVLSQGENVIKGDRLVIDLTTGRSRFENEGDLSNGQRVRGLFRPKSSEKGGRTGPGALTAPASGG